jgi:centromere/kinetochore protein ZW10
MLDNDSLKQAIVDSVEHGTYPEPDVSSAEVPSTLLPALLADLQKARDDVKVCYYKHLVYGLHLMNRG